MTNGDDNNGWRERADSMDRRLDRLTERHESLTQSVELMHRDWEERWKKMDDTQARNEVLIGQALEAINSLARIAQSHERRLDNMEGQR